MENLEDIEYSEEKVAEIMGNIVKLKNLRTECENDSLEIIECIRLKKATIAAIFTSYGIELAAIAVIIFSNSKYNKLGLACIETLITAILLEAIRFGIIKSNKVEGEGLLTDLDIELEETNLTKELAEADLNIEVEKYLKLEREKGYL